MTDYKQLCAELLKGYEILLGDLKFDNRLAKRARAALAEPEIPPDRPDRLRVGDIWEFETKIYIKGKRKPIDKLLQWEVKGWHNGQWAWELQSLDGEHRIYLMEFAPGYEEMRFIGSKNND